MTKTKNNSTSPLSVRFTAEERRWLERQAAGMSLSAYIRSCALKGVEVVRRTRGKFPVADHRILAQLLGKLGKERLAESLSHIAYAVRMGILPVSRETEAAIRKACQDISEMKRMLMKALGIKEH